MIRGRIPPLRVVSHGFERESGFAVVIDRGAKPAEKRPDVGRLRIRAIGLEILFFVRDPNAPAEFMFVIVHGNFDDAAYE